MKLDANGIEFKWIRNNYRYTYCTKTKVFSIEQKKKYAWWKNLFTSRNQFYYEHIFSCHIDEISILMDFDKLINKINK